MNKEQYIDFLKSKMEIATETGFDIDISLMKFADGTELKPHQRNAIRWALKGGRRAIILGRKGVATELNADYWSDGLRYMRTAESEVEAPTLFDLDKAI